MKKKLTKIQPLSEVIKQQSKLHAKYKEYSLKTTEELKEMYNILGGGYKQVCRIILETRILEDLDSKQTKELPEGEA